jgi:quinoprotein glucose dehydrogenase
MRVLSALLLLATGLGMALPGLYLAALGGSFYYLFAGILILVSAWLVFRRRDSGVILYWLMYLGTIAWSLSEVGLDGWALMPRLVFLGAAGLWLLAFVRLPARRAWMWPVGIVICLLPALCLAVFGGSQPTLKGVVVAAAAATPAGSGTDGGQWSHYGGSAYGTRYSALAQITPANVASLRRAWVYHADRRPAGPAAAPRLEMTPLMVDGLLYGCDAHSDVFALDPVTGAQVWRHTVKLNAAVIGRGVCRGVAYYKAPMPAGHCPARILVGTTDNHLIAVDAKTGKSCTGFGNKGSVDLSAGEGLSRFASGLINPTSPPTIVGGVAVIGSYVVDNQGIQAPPGVVRGYDVVTGALRWAFDPGRPDLHDGPPAGQSYMASTPNSWAPFSADQALGLVYLPMGNGSPDMYGANRTPQTDRFSSAVVALDVKTGAVRWVFQTVHHDLWDYDLAAQPVLTDFPVAHGTKPALIEATKTGQIFVLDRRTGQPITSLEERPVPASTIPGERASPTQPFSTGMPSFAGPRLTEQDMWGMTPFDQLYCRILFRRARYEGPFTPLRLGPSIRMPGELGGIDWGSVALDERSGILIVNSNVMADYDELIPRSQADAEHLFARNDPRRKRAGRPRYRGAAMAGTPYGAHLGPFLTGLGIPCQRPPYGFLSAIDLKTRKIVWQHELGDASNSGPFGLALGLGVPLGTPNIGSSLVTGGRLIFIAATQDRYFRALDERDGQVLWSERLPAGGHATPITYMGRDGSQYVVIAAGGNPAFKTGSNDSLVAYRLAPRAARQ